MTGRYHAPFAEHGSHTIDADIANRLLKDIRLDLDDFFHSLVDGFRSQQFDKLTISLLT